MLNEKGRCCSYTFQENENTVVPERIEEIAVNSVFGEGENAINISAEELVGSVQAQLNSTKTALDKATEENGKLQAKINAMTEAEHRRRVDLVRSVIKDKLSYMQKNGGCDISDNACDDLLTDEALNDFAAMTDKDGAFNGDKIAAEKVSARCAEKMCEANKAKNNAKETRFAWENGGEGEGVTEKTGIDAYLSEYDTATRK